MSQNINKELIRFVEESPTSFHAIANFRTMLNEAGYIELMENQKWEIEEKGKYYVTRNDSSIIAFTVPKKDFKGFQMIASHSDSPTFKVKENAEMEVEGHYTKLNVEGYGGTLCSPWFDRPLSIAGRVVIKTENGIESRLIKVNRDLLMIPNLAIHMNREANSGYNYNIQKDLLPVYGDQTAKGTFYEMVAKEAGTTKENILGTDLFLYNRVNGTIWGANEEYVSGPRLDDLQCAFASMKGLIASESTESIAVCAVFDNEESGSSTKQGAGGTFFYDVLQRLNKALGHNEEDYLVALANSFMISADNAHAIHPNHPEVADPTHRPYMNEGIVIKHHAGQRYTTDALSNAIFKLFCEKTGVPYQSFFNRSDKAGGSTLGNISNTQVSLNTVDIGLPQWAMHSPYETCGSKDTEYFVNVSKVFFSSSLEMVTPGSYELK